MPLVLLADRLMFQSSLLPSNEMRGIAEIGRKTPAGGKSEFSGFDSYDYNGGTAPSLVG